MVVVTQFWQLDEQPKWEGKGLEIKCVTGCAGLLMVSSPATDQATTVIQPCAEVRYIFQHATTVIDTRSEELTVFARTDWPNDLKPQDSRMSPISITCMDNFMLGKWKHK